MNIIVIVSDTLRKDALGCYGTARMLEKTPKILFDGPVVSGDIQGSLIEGERWIL